MEFKLIFNMDSKAFRHEPEKQVMAFLNEVSARIFGGEVSGLIFDPFGTMVGNFEIVERDET